MPSPLGPALKENFPDVVNYVRFRDGGGESFIKANGKVVRMNVSFSDPAVFSVFTFPLKYGSATSALNNLQDIVLTKEKAKQLFGTDNVVGRTIEIKMDEYFIPFNITAVTEKIPANSSIQFELLGNFNYMETTNSGKRGVNNWRRSSYITYVQLNPGSGLVNDVQKLAALRNKYYPDENAESKNWRQIPGYNTGFAGSYY